MPTAHPMPDNAAPSVPAARRLGQPQMAFVRSWAEGLDLVAAWNRYLYVDGAGDGRRARGELQRLLDELRSLARAHGRPQVAALLRRDPQAMPERGARVPTLDEFAAQQPHDYYSESELIELYQEQHGGPTRAAPPAGASACASGWSRPSSGSSKWALALRNPKTRCRPGSTSGWRVGWPWRACGGWQTSCSGCAPRATTGIAAFRGSARRGRLASCAGCASMKPRWAPCPRPALAPLSAIDTTALTPAPRVGIVPLERFRPPTERDGSRGTNRAAAERCKVAAANDYEAVHAWLRLRVAGTHTWRTYRKEAERFLLWAVMGRRKALSSLDGDDCVAYRDFLAQPGPEWTGPRNAQRWSEQWRPFEGALSVRSQALAIIVVRSLCEWLVRRHYLDSNPWDDVPARPDAPSMPQLRALSQKQWDLVQAWLAEQHEQAPSPALHRLQFILDFAYMTGMRLAELTAARLGWLRHEPLDDGPDGDEMAWSIMVLGKRRKWREVPVPDPAMQALQTYFAKARARSRIHWPTTPRRR
jgi:site-specific recombinase XerD